MHDRSLHADASTRAPEDSPDTLATGVVTDANREGIEARFWPKVDRSGGPDACHLWTAYREGGYGQFRVGTVSNVAAHRVAYELANGPIPVGKSVLHACDNPRCVNASHLAAGTQQENATDMQRKGRGTIGERNSHAKLTAEIVTEARELAAAGQSPSALARRFGVTPQAMHCAVNGTSWRHLPQPERLALTLAIALMLACCFAPAAFQAVTR